MRRLVGIGAPLAALAGGTAAAAPCAPAQISACGAAAPGCTQALRGPSCGSQAGMEPDQTACGIRLGCQASAQGGFGFPASVPEGAAAATGCASPSVELS